MVDIMDYRENITFKKTVALKNFVRMKDYDLKQTANDMRFRSSERKIKILLLLCIVSFIIITSCLVSIFVMIGNESNLGAVQYSHCLTRENKYIGGNERPVIFDDYMTSGKTKHCFGSESNLPYKTPSSFTPMHTLKHSCTL